jgi:hypothetical protein
LEAIWKLKTAYVRTEAAKEDEISLLPVTSTNMILRHDG